MNENIENGRNEILDSDNMKSLENQETGDSNVAQTDVVKTEDGLEMVDGEVVYTSEWLRENTTIGGWHKFFFFVILINPLIDLFSTYSSYDSVKSMEVPGISMFFGGLIFLDVVLLGMACYTIYAFVRRMPNAVFWARAIIIIFFVIGLLGTFVNSAEGVSTTPMDFIRCIVWFGIWITFLSVSVSVQETIPPEFRKVTLMEWGLLAIVVIVPSLIAFYGFSLMKAAL